MKLFKLFRIDLIKSLAMTGVAQAIVQASGLICGFITIRLLPTNEFALYTIANAMLGTMTILSDAGINTGVLFLGGKYWTSPSEMEEVINTGLILRKKFALGSLVITVPILFYLLYRHNATIVSSVLIIIALVPAFWATLSDSILEIPMKLHKDFYPLQRNQVGVNIGRMVLMFLMLLLFPFTAIGLLSNSIPRIVGNMRLRKLNRKYFTNQSGKEIVLTSEYANQILNIVKKSLPGLIYYCISGQVALWIISFMGNTNSVAQIGALSKIAMIFTVFNSVVSMMAIPSFAKLVNERKVLLSYFLKLQICVLFVVLSLIIATMLFPSVFLWILGPQYANLSKELVLVVISGGLILMAGVCFGLYSSRGIVMSPFRSIVVNIVAVVLGAYFFNMKSLSGVLYMNIMIGSVELINTYSFFFQKIGQ